MHKEQMRKQDMSKNIFRFIKRKTQKKFLSKWIGDFQNKQTKENEWPAKLGKGCQSYLWWREFIVKLGTGFQLPGWPV